jgi:hypothetical protein
MSQEKIMVVCVLEKDLHTPESVLVKCSGCSANVWVSPWNLDKTPVCAACVLIEISRDKKANIKIARKDVERAVNFLKERS